MKMAGNTKRIRGDAMGKPAPQYFSELNDAYEYLEGENGASKVMAETGAIVDLETVKNLLAVLGTIEDADSLNTMIGLLKNLKAKDFATQTTLAAALTELTAIKDTDGIKKIVDALPAGTNEIGEVVISGDETLPSSAPVTGIKTLIPGVAAEIFAGASKKANRVAMMIRNLSKYSEGFRLRFGESSITDAKGFILEPQSVVVLEFNPKVETAIYAIPETNTLQVEVYEV
jgi:hypothetical protein